MRPFSCEPTRDDLVLDVWMKFFNNTRGTSSTTKYPPEGLHSPSCRTLDRSALSQLDPIRLVPICDRSADATGPHIANCALQNPIEPHCTCQHACLFDLSLPTVATARLGDLHSSIRHAQLYKQHAQRRSRAAGKQDEAAHTLWTFTKRSAPIKRVSSTSQAEAACRSGGMAVPGHCTSRDQRRIRLASGVETVWCSMHGCSVMR